MVRRPMSILEVLYEPRDGPRGAHVDPKIQEYSNVQRLDCLCIERKLLESLFSLMNYDIFPTARSNDGTSVSAWKPLVDPQAAAMSKITVYITGIEETGASTCVQIRKKRSE
jgi:hypothetical protein